MKMSVFKKLAQREKTLKIIIVGAGKVGATLADKLTAEGNDVVIVDKDPERVSRLGTTYDVLGITGNGSSYGTLIEAGIETADLIIAVTDSDELNLLCCALARKVGDCASIARVRNPDYAGELSYLRDKLGITMILNPELEAAKEITRIIHFPYALSVNSFAKGTVDMIRFKIPEGNPLDGMRLMDLQQTDDMAVLVCAAERGEELIIPNGRFTLAAGDIISVVAPPGDAYRFFKKIKLSGRRVSSVMIIGGGKTSYYLAQHLCRTGISVKIIELDLERCRELSELLPQSAVIVNGDGTDESLLLQEDIENIGAVIPLTGLDEENILLSLYAMRVNPGVKVITKVNHINFSGVINTLELGSIVYPRYMTAETIRTYVRAKKNSIGSNIETVYRLFDDRAEAIEFRIESPAEYTGVPLKDLKLKDNLLIASIIRRERSFIPGGSDCLKPGDSVVIVTTHSGFDNIRDILA